MENAGAVTVGGGSGGMPGGAFAGLPAVAIPTQDAIAPSCQAGARHARPPMMGCGALAMPTLPVAATVRRAVRQLVSSFVYSVRTRPLVAFRGTGAGAASERYLRPRSRRLGDLMLATCQASSRWSLVTMPGTFLKTASR